MHQGHDWVWKVRSDHALGMVPGCCRIKTTETVGFSQGECLYPVQGKRTDVPPVGDSSERGVQNTEKEKEQKGKTLNQDVITLCKCPVNLQSIIL